MKKDFLEFLDLYRRMRAAQKNYFGTKEKLAMYDAKDRERALDKLAVELNAKYEEHA